MQNVKPGVRYPSCLLTGGLHDPRVQYWEISKFAATLRHAMSSSDGGGGAGGPPAAAASNVCLKIDTAAGHFSASDRYKYLRELSFDYAFLLDEVGLAGGGDKKVEVAP
jgi:oligopeptidase B